MPQRAEPRRDQQVADQMDATQGEAAAIEATQRSHFGARG